MYENHLSNTRRSVQSFSIPQYLLDKLDDTVPKGERSAFVTLAISAALRKNGEVASYGEMPIEKLEREAVTKVTDVLGIIRATFSKRLKA